MRKMDRGNAVSADDPADIPPPAGDGEAETEGEVEIDEKSKGLEGALLRTEKMELRLYELEKAAVDNGDVRRAALLEKHRLAAAKGIAELREQVRVQMEKEGRLADADALESEYLKSITMAKNNILGVPSAAIPAIMPFLRDQNDAAAVEALLEGKLKDALRSTAAGVEVGH